MVDTEFIESKHKVMVPRAAVFFDAGFINKQAHRLVGTVRLDFMKMAEKLVGDKRKELLRVYYYDCPPYVFPEAQLSKTAGRRQRDRQSRKEKFFRGLELTDRMILRRGRLITGIHSKYPIEEVEQDLVAVLQEVGSDNKQLLERLHEKLHEQVREKGAFIQKGVDSRLITDLVSLCALEKVATVAIVSNDSDFSPALKFAVACGVETVLAGLENRDDMSEHMLKYVDKFVPMTKLFLKKFILPVVERRKK